MVVPAVLLGPVSHVHMSRKERHRRRLFAAAAAGSLSSIKKLQSKRVIQVHSSTDHKGRSALHLAARGKANGIQSLLVSSQPVSSMLTTFLMLCIMPLPLGLCECAERL